MLFDPQQLTRCANFLGLPLLPVAGQEQATAPADGVARIGLLGASQVRGGGGNVCLHRAVQAQRLHGCCLPCLLQPHRPMMPCAWGHSG